MVYSLWLFSTAMNYKPYFQKPNPKNLTIPSLKSQLPNKIVTMPFISHLQFGDNELSLYNRDYKVKDVKCYFKRNHDALHPTGEAVCDYIEVTAFSPGKMDLGLQEWFINNSTESGRIIVGQNDPFNDSIPQWKQIIFNEAQCFSLTENYKIDEKKRTLTLKIIAREVKIEDVDFLLKEMS